MAEAWRTAPSFEASAFWQAERVLRRESVEVEHVDAGRITRDFLPLLRTAPALERGFAEEEMRSGAPEVVMLGYAVWRGRYGGGPSVLGRSLVLDGHAHRIVGVMPPELHRLPLGADREVWLPLRPDSYAGESVATATLLARLKQPFRVQGGRGTQAPAARSTITEDRVHHVQKTGYITADSEFTPDIRSSPQVGRQATALPPI